MKTLPRRERRRRTTEVWPMSCKHYGDLPRKGLRRAPPGTTSTKRRTVRSHGARGLLKMMLKERIMEMSRYTSSGLPYYRRLSPFALKLQVASTMPSILLLYSSTPKPGKRDPYPLSPPRGGIHYVDFRNWRLNPPAVGSLVLPAFSSRDRSSCACAYDTQCSPIVERTRDAN